MNNYYKVIVALGIIMIAGVGSWLYFGAYKNIQAKVLEERKISITAYIQNQVNQLAVINDFNIADSVRQDQVFKSFFENIQSSEIFRIKVFNRDYKIIWSNLKELIGQDASTNQEVKDALVGGKITLKPKSLKPEQVTERRFKDFTETYVPIANDKGEYIGVVEVYQTYASLGIKINKELTNIAVKDIAGTIAAFVVLALVIRRLMPRQV